MMQGDSYKIPIEIIADGGVTEPSVFSEVEIVFGHIVKRLSKGEVSYDAVGKVFLFPMSQKESMNLPQKVSVQVRVKTKDSKDVIGVNLGEIDIEKTLSKAVL